VFDEHVLCSLCENAAKYEVVSQQSNSRCFKTKCDLSRVGSTRSRQPPGRCFLPFTQTQPGSSRGKRPSSYLTLTSCRTRLVYTRLAQLSDITHSCWSRDVAK
jgi:hypothetical protein